MKKSIIFGLIILTLLIILPLSTASMPTRLEGGPNIMARDYFYEQNNDSVRLQIVAAPLIDINEKFTLKVPSCNLVNNSLRNNKNYYFDFNCTENLTSFDHRWSLFPYLDDYFEKHAHNSFQLRADLFFYDGEKLISQGYVVLKNAEPSPTLQQEMNREKLKANLIVFLTHFILILILGLMIYVKVEGRKKKTKLLASLPLLLRILLGMIMIFSALFFFLFSLIFSLYSTCYFLPECTKSDLIISIVCFLIVTAIGVFLIYFAATELRKRNKKKEVKKGKKR